MSAPYLTARDVQVTAHFGDGFHLRAAGSKRTYCCVWVPTFGFRGRKTVVLPHGAIKLQGYPMEFDGLSAVKSFLAQQLNIRAVDAVEGKPNPRITFIKENGGG
jgi:hypothetical protein